jgi:lysophospholipase L1-like esterase
MRTPGTARVLYIGDSTCWGLGVLREHTFAARAAELAARQLGHPVEIVNGCIPGHSSFQARAMLRRLLRFGPDVLVFYLGARNDADRHRYFRDADIPARLARLDTRWHRVRLLQAMEAAFDGFYKKLLRKPLSLARRARVSPMEFQENLEALLAATSIAGARSVVLMPPWSASLLDRYPLIPEYQRILAETAREAGAISVPLQPAFSLRREDFLYHEDRLHFNDAGHELTAGEVAPAIVSILAAPTGRDDFEALE